jgi:heptosyltransferase-2
MAQTWLVSERKLRLASRADALFRPLLPFLRRMIPPRPFASEPPQRILVSELWHIGDVVIAMPFLAALRQLYPAAKITLLARSHARATLMNTGLVDDVISYEFPWTFLEEDRRPGWRDLSQMPAVVLQLRAARFDLAFDCSRDGRNHLLLFLTGAARRIGFAFGGGDYLLTDAVPVGSLNNHRTEDWLRLLKPLESMRANESSPIKGVDALGGSARLVVSESEQRWASEFLRAAGVSRDQVLIAVHPGGSSRLKRWPVEHFVALAHLAAAHPNTRILWIIDPSGTGADAELPAGSIVARPSLRELIALLAECRLLVSNDGGPMHLAGALEIPTFAVYSWGNPAWWRPYLDRQHSFVRREDIECRPCAGHCVFAEPICLTGLEFDAVARQLRSVLAAMRSEPVPESTRLTG